MENQFLYLVKYRSGNSQTGAGRNKEQTEYLAKVDCKPCILTLLSGIFFSAHTDLDIPVYYYGHSRLS